MQDAYKLLPILNRNLYFYNCTISSKYSSNGIFTLSTLKAHLFNEHDGLDSLPGSWTQSRTVSLCILLIQHFRFSIWQIIINTNQVNVNNIITNKLVIPKYWQFTYNVGQLCLTSAHTPVPIQPWLYSTFHYIDIWPRNSITYAHSVVIPPYTNLHYLSQPLILAIPHTLLSCLAMSSTLCFQEAFGSTIMVLHHNLST